jgi:lysophospholipase L1-like esterase
MKKAICFLVILSIGICQGGMNMAYQYDPANGYLDAGTYPNPTSEEEHRTQSNDLPMQALEFINDLDSKKESSANITTNRKLSATGNFTGTLDGYPIVGADPGQSTIVAGHTVQLAAKANKNKITDISYLLQQHDKVIVGTGDSLSFNSSTFGAFGEASECDPGILSWSFLVKDAIHRNDAWFTDAEKIMYRFIKNDTTTYYNNANIYKMPFNGKMLNVIPVQNDEEFVITYKHKNPNNKTIIYMSHNPLNNCCSFDVYVDGVFAKNVDNDGTGKNNNGYEMLAIELDIAGDNVLHEIKLTNFIQTASVPATTGALMQLFISGIGTKYTPVYLTGVGGQTSTWLLTNITERILQYNPDFVMITITANDLWQDISVETSETNLRSICAQIRAQNQDCQIMLMTSTSQKDPADPDTEHGSYAPDSMIRPYNEAMFKVALEFGCYYIDLIDLFEHIPISEYRHDNVHLTHYGNTIVARNVLNTIMGGSLHDKKMVDSDLVYSATTLIDMQSLEGYCFAQTLNVGTGEIAILSQSINNPVLQVVKTNESTVRVYLKYCTNWLNTGIVKHVAVTQFSTNALNLIFRQIGFGPNYVDFRIIKASDGSLTIATDWTNSASAFYLYIKF